MNKQELIKMYSSGLSMFEISRKFECSVHKVVYWMKKFDIVRRDRSAAIYLKFNPNGDPFKIKSDLDPADEMLKGLGLGIYWGEGAKTSMHSLRVANTDVGIIKTFRKFLLEICQLNENKISYSLICFNDIDPILATSFWSKELGISPAKFGKITTISKQGKGTYKHKSIYGVCTIYAGNMKLRNWLMSELEKIKNKPD